MDARTVDDVERRLKKGDLKFTLDGYKLKGSWVLVRTSGRLYGARAGGDGRSWLLIKHRDDWSGDLDIAEFAPRSVKSDGDFEDILAAGQPDDLACRIARPKAAMPARCSTKIIEKAAALKSGEAPDSKAARLEGTRKKGRDREDDPIGEEERPAAERGRRADGKSVRRSTKARSAVASRARSTRRRRGAGDRGARSRWSRTPRRRVHNASAGCPSASGSLCSSA